MELNRHSKAAPHHFDHDLFSHKMDYQWLVQTILKKIRGNRSQTEMDTALGHKFNQWHKWESGQKILRWSELERIDRSLQLHLADHLANFISQTEVGDLNGRNVLQIFRRKFGNLSLKELADYLETHPSKLRRIFMDEQDFEVSLFLKFLGVCTRILPAFLTEFAPGVLPEYFGERVEAFEKQRSLEARFPWLSSIEAAIELRAYKQALTHDLKILSELTGLPEKKIDLGLQLLLENGAIEKEEEKYQLNIKRVDMESGALADSAALAKYWTEKALHRFDTFDGVPTSRKGWAYRIFPVSNQGQEKIRDLIRGFVGDLHSLLVDDAKYDREHIQVIMLHSFDLQEFEDQ